MKTNLKANGIATKQGATIDATLIASPSSRKKKKKKKKGERDLEMYKTNKGNQWHFRMKVCIGVDKENGFIHSIENDVYQRA